MCVEGLRAIPLGCSDCYDKDNVPEAERGGLAEQAVVAGQGAGPARAGRGPGGQGPGQRQAGSPHRALCLAQHRLEQWQPPPEQLLSKHLGCCDSAVHHPGL